MGRGGRLNFLGRFTGPFLPSVVPSFLSVAAWKDGSSAIFNMLAHQPQVLLLMPMVALRHDGVLSLRPNWITRLCPTP